MKRNTIFRRLAAAALILTLLLALAACGKQSAPAPETKEEGPDGVETKEEAAVPVPGADAFADGYFRVVAGVPRATAGASLAAAQAASDVLGFAATNELRLADVETLRANMLAAWESLTDDERMNFDENFPNLNDLVNSCYEDWEANYGRFDDAGAAETMEKLLADETAQQSWEALSAHTWTLGNSE